MKNFIKLLFVLCSINSFSQYDVEQIKSDTIDLDETSFFSKIKPRIYIGGEASLSVNSFRSFVYLSPLIGYDITEKFSGGFSAMYQFSRVNFGTQSFNYSAVGAGTFLRFRPIKQVILQTEFDIYNTNDFVGNPVNRINVPAFMAGIGYANEMRKGMYSQILLMYDFINDPNMPMTPFIFNALHLKFGLVWHLDSY